MGYCYIFQILINPSNEPNITPLLLPDWNKGMTSVGGNPTFLHTSSQCLLMTLPTTPETFSNWDSTKPIKCPPLAQYVLLGYFTNLKKCLNNVKNYEIDKIGRNYKIVHTQKKEKQKSFVLI